MKNLFKSPEQLVAEIHNEVDTAQDRLLANAEEILKASKPTSFDKLESHAKRLEAIGFVNTPIPKKAKGLREKKREQETAIVKTTAEAELIRYYKQTYPFLKFLTEEELDRICDKYELIYAPVGNYVNNVPEKNLADIEKAQAPKQEDILENTFELIPRYGNGDFLVFLRSIGHPSPFFTQKEVIDICIRYNGYNVEQWTKEVQSNTWLFVAWDKSGRHGYYDFSEVRKVNRAGLFIAAPKSHFNLSGLTKKKKGFFNITVTEIKDPIVFRYVRGGIQVITKWGLEASDPLLLNEIDN